MSDYMKYDGRKPEPPYLTPMDYDSLVAQNECLAAELAEAQRQVEEWRRIADDRRTRGLASEAERDALRDQIQKMRGQWIHSIHKDECLKLLKEDPCEKQS